VEGKAPGPENRLVIEKKKKGEKTHSLSTKKEEGGINCRARSPYVGKRREGGERQLLTRDKEKKSSAAGWF